MAKSKKTRSEPLPIRSSSQVKEDDSKNLFVDLIQPWMVASWIERDFGIDAIVEITKPIARSRDQIVTGKRFSVQLKSSNSARFDKKTLSLSVPKEKINYWMQSFEPVLLVYVDLKSQAAYYRWIDDLLVKELFKLNPDWVAHETVSIRFEKSDTLTQRNLSTIESYVLVWKRPAKSILTPGNYFNFSSEAHQYALLLRELNEKYRITTFSSEVDELCQEVSNSIYTIAIIGLSRAGKSTLINALLRQDVSPVGILPTTGIPITILPTNKNEAVVTFENREPLTGKVNSSFLSEYTSQDKNPRNIKRVKLVRVNIVNTLLERGFALCDVPGLDDADPMIKNVAKTTIYSSNAIIYVISLASFTHGEFRINDQNINDLRELRGRMDRVFLVFNKIDALSKQEFEVVRDRYIEPMLREYGILDFLAAPPIYISSKIAFESRMSKDNGTDSVSQLEQVLWEYLINQNRTGLHKILSNFANNLELIERCRNVTKARLLSAEERQGVESEINMVASEIENLRAFVAGIRSEVYSQVNIYVLDRFKNVIEHLNNDLYSYNSPSALPENGQTTSFLETEAYKIISDVYEYLQTETYKLQTNVNQWVSEKLKQVELSFDGITDDQDFQMPDISRYTGKVHSFFSDNKHGYSGLIENVIIAIGSAIEWLFTKIWNAFSSDEKVMKREIKEIVSQSRRAYNQIQTELLQNVSQYLNGVCRAVENRTIDRTRVYLAELQSRLQPLERPMSRAEKSIVLEYINDLSELERDILSNYNHLKDYADGIEKFAFADSVTAPAPKKARRVKNKGK